jgi:hypothetical protein
LSAPYVGQGSAAFVAGGFGAVVVGTEDGGRVLPHETRAPTAAIATTAARLLAIAALSAEMAPEIGEES